MESKEISESFAVNGQKPIWATKIQADSPLEAEMADIENRHRLQIAFVMISPQ